MVLAQNCIAITHEEQDSDLKGHQARFLHRITANFLPRLYNTATKWCRDSFPWGMSHKNHYSDFDFWIQNSLFNYKRWLFSLTILSLASISFMQLTAAYMQLLKFLLFTIESLELSFAFHRNWLILFTNLPSRIFYIKPMTMKICDICS